MRYSADQLRAYADLARHAAQPLTFAASLGLDEGAGEGNKKSVVPSFADLLQILGLVPDTLDVLSDRTGTSTGYIWVEGNARRSLTRFDLK